MILRPEPPRSPWSCWMRSAGAWKCFSKSLFSTSMKWLPAHLDSHEKQNRLFSIIAVCRGRHSIARELLFLLIGKAKLARGPLLSGQRPRYTLEMPSRKVVRNPRQRRITEERNLASRNLDRMSSREIIRLMNREDRKVAPAVGRAVPAIAGAVDEIVARMTVGGRLIYVGAGSSGRIGVLDASECPPTFGVSANLVRGLIAGGKKAVMQSVEGAEDRPEDGARDLRKIRLSKLDSVVGIAASGTTPYVLGAIAFAKKRGALTVGIAANRRSPLASSAQIAITPQVGPEILAGSTRLKAGTSQKLVLNMLSKIGRAHV